MVGSDEGEARDSASRTWAHSLRRGYDSPQSAKVSHDLYILTRRRGADEAPTRAYTHKHKQTHSAARRKQTNKQTNRRKESTVRAHAVAAPSSSEELGRLAPTPSKLWCCISLSLSHAEFKLLYAMKKKITTRRSRGVRHDRQEDV